MRQFGVRGFERRMNIQTPPENVDYIGITFNSDKFTRGPAWLSFRYVHDFHADDLWKLIDKIIQSIADFEISDDFIINSCIVDLVAGSGRIKLTDKSVSKRSILQMNNKDNLCLPRAIVAARAYVERGQVCTSSLHKE